VFGIGGAVHGSDLSAFILDKHDAASAAIEVDCLGASPLAEQNSQFIKGYSFTV